MQSNTKWYAQTPTGRTALKAQSDKDAIKEVETSKGWLKETTYAVVRVEMTVLKEYPVHEPTGRTLRSNIHNG